MPVVLTRKSPMTKRNSYRNDTALTAEQKMRDNHNRKTVFSESQFLLTLRGRIASGTRDDLARALSMINGRLTAIDNKSKG